MFGSGPNGGFGEQYIIEIYFNLRYYKEKINVFEAILIAIYIEVKCRCLNEPKKECIRKTMIC